MAENAKENEIEELLVRLEKTDDIDFLVSNMQILSGISNPKFADRVNDLKSRIEKTCKEKAETALASNEPLSQNSDYPEALQYTEYAKILVASDDEKNKNLGEALFQKAGQELAAYDKAHGLDNIDPNTPYAENYERLNDQIKPFEEIDQNDQILVGFAEKLDSERALDIVNLARMEVLSELAASDQKLTEEEIKELIEERAQQLVLETYTTLSTDCYVAGGFEKTTNEIIEELKRGKTVAELPENPDLLTFTRYAMTHIEDEREKSLPDTEQYKKVLEETLNDPKVLEDPEKLAALKYLIEHHNAFGLSGSDETVKKATRRMQQGALYMATSAVIANHTTRLQYNSTRIAQITGSLVPASLQKSIAELEDKYPFVKTAKKALIRGGLTMASSAVLGPFGPLLVSSAYAYKAFKDDKAKYAAEHGGSTKGYIQNLFTKDNLAKTISMAASPVISLVTLGMAGAGTTALVSTVTRGVMGLVPSTASISQQAQALRAQQEALDKKLVAINTKNLTDDEKKILQTITLKEISDPKKMTSQQKAVWEKLDSKDREVIEKEAENNKKRKKAIAWTLGIAAGGLVLAAIGYGAHEASQHGLFNGNDGNDGNNGLEGEPTQGSEGSEGAPAPSESSQGNETPDQSQDVPTSVHNPENLINSIDDKQLKFAANALAVSNKPGLVGMNNILKDIGYEGKIPGTSREMLDLLRSGNLNEQQQHALTDFIKENTYLDANGQPHLTKGTTWNAFYENRLAEHQAELRASQSSSSASTPHHENLGENSTGQNPDESSYEVRHQNPDNTVAQETQIDPLFAQDPSVQRAAAVSEWGTPENPGVSISGKNATVAWEQTDENGYTVRHIEEHKGIKYTDLNKDGIADELKTGRELNSTEVVTSPDGKVIETSETTYGRAYNGEAYVKNEVVTSYDNDTICKTETDYFANGNPKEIVETKYVQGSTEQLSAVKETDCYADGTPKQVSTTTYIEGSNNQPLSETTELYHRGQSEPHATQVREFDEFTGKQLSLKTTDHATGKVTIQSLTPAKETYAARAEVLTNWQQQASTMNHSSPEYAALSQKITRLTEAQKIFATQNKIMIGQQHVNG